MIQEIDISNRSRGTWFLFGAAVGMLLLWLLPKLPCFGLGYKTMPHFNEIKTGMTYGDVQKALGPEDGVIRAHELKSYDSHRYLTAPTMDFQKVEEEGGRHLFWLSRFECLLIFNVVSLDAKDRVVSTYSGYDTFFGME